MDDGATRRPHTDNGKNRNMVNKKGYIKTLEAVIAIIIIIMVGYILIAQPAEPAPDVPSVVKGVQKIITQSIQFNEQIRNNLTAPTLPPPRAGLPYDLLKKDINDTIAKNSPLGYDYACAICSNPGTCIAILPLEKSIYMIDVLIASGEKQQNPRIVRIWFWKKPTLNPEGVKICTKVPPSYEAKEQKKSYNNCEIIYKPCD